MLRFIIRRMVRAFVTLILFQSLLFALIHALPYDFTAFTLQGPSWRAFMQRQLGLDLPLWTQYLRWLSRFLRFDLGVSFQNWPAPVSAILFNRISRTLLLFLSAAILAYLLGIWLGKVIAWRRGGWLEFGVTLGGVAAYTSFAPWLGFVMINIFGWYLRWLPYQRLVNPNVWFNAPVMIDTLLTQMFITSVIGFVTFLLVRHISQRIKNYRGRWITQAFGLVIIGMGIGIWWSRSGLSYLAIDILAHLTLPLATVVLLSFGETMMIMRTAMLETKHDDYVLTARAKGLPDAVIRDRHVARNAILPVITRLALNLPFILVGSLVIERVFMWQATGEVIFSAIEYQDIPVLLGILSIVGILALAAHILLDVLYTYLDPRVRYLGMD
ncbi:MAG: ABC transporter permease [Anaerolineaceae bacterium]|nr:MAG: ABC transporter permease [Anaerolineaceae bacterium]